MVKLVCAIVGVAGSAFPVDIGASQLVGDLKKAIRAEKPNDFKDVDADNLQLFLAKQPVEDESGKEVVPVYSPSAEEVKEESLKWLPDEHRAALKLVKGESDDYIHALTAGEPILGSKTLTTWFYTKNNMELPSSEQVHVLVVVPEQAQGQPRLWLVTGSVDNALNTKGIRCRLYWMATLRIGYYDPVRRTPDKNVAFWYEGKKLCFHVLFKTEDAALLFETDLRTGPLTLSSALYDQAVETRVAQINAVSPELQRVFYTDYVLEESDSPQNTISSASLTTSVSNLDTSTDEFEYQRIERKYFFPHGKAESCHLVSRKQSRDHKREYAKYDRDPNNRLALSRDMHGWFDGMSSYCPIVNMLPGSVDKNPSIGNRHKVEVFVKAVDAHCADCVFSRLKEGSTKTDDPLVMKTFVHVEDPETFCFCMRWKYDDNDTRQRSFFDMTPAVD